MAGRVRPEKKENRQGWLFRSLRDMAKRTKAPHLFFGRVPCQPFEDTGESLPAVYASVKGFLVPVDPDSDAHFRVADEIDDDEAKPTRFPEETLDMLDTATHAVLKRPPCE